MNTRQHVTPDLRCWAEIDTSALRHNARTAGKLSGGGMECVMAIVKANAYGHRLSIVVSALKEEIGAFAVASLTEAIEVERHAARDRDGGRAPIYILSPALPGECAEISQRGFIPAISTLEEVANFAQHGSPEHPVQLHVVTDTGMGRMGVLPDEADELLTAVRAESRVRLDSLSTHFPSSDEDESFTRTQEAGFRELVQILQQKHGPFSTHIANSAGILHYPRRKGETVRAGLMLYGISPLPDYQLQLRPALVWKTRITLVRELPAGWGISYGRSCITDRPSRIATLAAGYGDGYPRQVSGKGACVEVQGIRCPVMGRVTMDQMMIDVSHLPSPPAPGDTAVLLGGTITAGEIASLAGTIPWHIFTSITDRTVRIASTGSQP